MLLLSRGLQALGRGPSPSLTLQAPATTHSSREGLTAPTATRVAHTQLPTPNLTLELLKFALVNLYWTNISVGTGCPTTCTDMAHAVGTKNPLEHLPSTPLRCPGRAAWDRESHCHLVGKGRIASALPLGTAGSKPPSWKILGPAGEQDLEKP